MTQELYKKYRPKSLSELAGQDEVVKMLTDLGKRKAIPHCLLMTGPSGVGKTTTARILRHRLGCSDHDFCEVNAAKERGIDMVRDISRRMGLAPIGGKSRVWLIDEAASLSSDAQSAFLKMLEDTPSHVYFMLATTHPQKLKPTIRSRSTEIKLKPLNAKDMLRLIVGILELEKVDHISASVLEKLTDVADGSPRKALVLLHSIIGLGNEEEQLAVIERGDSSRDAIEIARALIGTSTRWPTMAKILKGIEGLEEQSEGIRRLVLAYCSSVLLGGRGASARAADVIEAFRDDFFNTGKAGLILACFEIIEGSKQ